LSLAGPVCWIGSSTDESDLVGSFLILLSFAESVWALPGDVESGVSGQVLFGQADFSLNMLHNPKQGFLG
jgi:hypothetical protein